MDKNKTALRDMPTVPGKAIDKKDIKEKTLEMIAQLSEIQDKLYAQEKYAVLVVIQGMDASGKDGAVKNVFSGVNPAGCHVTSFKAPDAIELKHDYLWRIHKQCPPRGMIHIFNRSQYEDILVPSVHKLMDEKEIEKRYDAINAFEKLLVDNGTILIKCYLHVSEEEQMERINERKTNPEKKWKYQESDIREVRLRGEYLKVYQSLIDRCDVAAPWHVIPSDKNWYKSYCLLKAITDKLKEYDISYPVAE